MKTAMGLSSLAWAGQASFECLSGGTLVAANGYSGAGAAEIQEIAKA